MKTTTSSLSHLATVITLKSLKLHPHAVGLHKFKKLLLAFVNFVLLVSTCNKTGNERMTGH